MYYDRAVMTKEGAEILREAQQTGRTSEEARQSQRQINEEVNWDLRQMLPYLYGNERHAFVDE